MPTLTATPARRPGAIAAPARAVRAFAVLTVVTSVAILVQAVTAGQFVDKESADSWITVHGVIADVAWGLALVAAAVGMIGLRRSAPRLVVASVVLFVITLAQTGIGHLITDNGDDGLIALHVPLAVAIFGLTVWLSVRAVRLTRDVSAD